MECYQFNHRTFSTFAFIRLTHPFSDNLIPDTQMAVIGMDGIRTPWSGQTDTLCKHFIYIFMRVIHISGYNFRHKRAKHDQI